VTKISTPNILILYIYFFAGQISPLHLAKNALVKIENCKAAKGQSPVNNNPKKNIPRNHIARFI
jgi:hypothetical protein